MTVSPAVNVVLTGSAGYLGSRIVQRLTQFDYNVIPIDKFNASYPLDLGNLNDLRGLRLPEDYYFIHLAFPLPGTFAKREFSEIVRTINENITTIFCPEKTLLVSSTAVYPLTSMKSPHAKPWEIYGTLKLETEKIFQNRFKSVTIFRPGTLIEANRSSMMMKFLKQLLQSRFPVIPYPISVVHPFTHTDDLVEAILGWIGEVNSFEGVFDIVANDLMTFEQISKLDEKHPVNFFIRIPQFLLRRIGSDRFPIFKISKWHFSALTYDYTQSAPHRFSKYSRSCRDIFNF
jgi:nucleoside-diphosphate-sugar epimerase